MLTEALIAVAGAGGAAVVQAAGTDAWTGLRQRVARLLGRGDTQRERAELERLDRTAQALEEADAAGETERARLRQEASWQTRFESLLENLEDSEQQQVATELQALVAEQQEFAARQGVVGNTFNGPAAVQVGNHNQQENRFHIASYLPAPVGPRVVLQVSNPSPCTTCPTEARTWAIISSAWRRSIPVTSRSPSPAGVSSSPVIGACSSREARTGQLRSPTCSLPAPLPHGS